MPTAAPGRVTDEVHLTSSSLATNQILRSFDQLRRRLALLSFDDAGAGAGLVDLTWFAHPPKGSRVTIEATAVDGGDHWQRIQYQAILSASTGGSGVVASAVGYTVGVHPRAEVTG